MIRAVVFDLDGTLVRTEELKALSYARAAAGLKRDLPEGPVINAYKEVVGLSRQEVSEYILRVFHLEELARSQMEKYHSDAPWQVLARGHLTIYKAMIETPGILERHKCPYNLGLLKYVRREGFRVGLATLSHRPETERILVILGLQSLFDVVATREDVRNGKPDPEIYLHVSRQLGVAPHETLVIEDSVNGIRAARAAGMACIAVTSTITRTSVHLSGLLDRQWIVDDPTQLMTVARQLIAEQRHADLVTEKRPSPETPAPWNQS